MILYPLILIKTRLQYQSSKSIRSVIDSVLRKEGFAGLYQGLSPQLVKVRLHPAARVLLNALVWLKTD
jgi:hypothetical protein